MASIFGKVDADNIGALELHLSVGSLDLDFVGLQRGHVSDNFGAVIHQNFFCGSRQAGHQKHRENRQEQDASHHSSKSRVRVRARAPSCNAGDISLNRTTRHSCPKRRLYVRTACLPKPPRYVIFSRPGASPFPASSSKSRMLELLSENHLLGIRAYSEASLAYRPLGSRIVAKAI